MQVSPQPLGAISVQEFCARFGVSRSFVYSQIAKGRLITRKAGRRTLIMIVDADGWASAVPSTSS
jgi:excisionase family DNA binding protein